MMTMMPTKGRNGSGEGLGDAAVGGRMRRGVVVGVGGSGRQEFCMR